MEFRGLIFIYAVIMRKYYKLWCFFGKTPEMIVNYNFKCNPF